MMTIARTTGGLPSWARRKLGLSRCRLQPLRPFLSVAILMGFAIVHGIRRYVWRHFIIFFFFTFVISWSYETSSIL